LDFKKLRIGTHLLNIWHITSYWFAKSIALRTKSMPEKEIDFVPNGPKIAYVYIGFSL